MKRARTFRFMPSEHARYVEVFGIGPKSVELLVAVMAHQLVHGHGVTRLACEVLLGGKVTAAELLRRGFIEKTACPIRGKLNQPLIATNRAWREFWPDGLLKTA